jgi:hypothetical protein
LLDEFLIEIHPIGQEYIRKGACVLVVAVGLDRNVFTEGEVSGGVLGVVAVGLAFLRAVDSAEADAFSMVAVQNFDGVAVQVPPPSTLEAVTATVQALMRPLFGR